MIPDYFPNDASLYLREELAIRKRRSPHYSMRAFARDLDISPSFLCEFLAGRQGLSRERVLWIARQLKFSNAQQDHFWDLIEARFGRTPQAKKAASIRAMQRNKEAETRLSLEKFEVLSEWYHFAILEILNLAGPQRSLEDIAKILDISVLATKKAINRMIKLGLLSKAETGGYKINHDVTLVGDVGASHAIQMAHREMLYMHAKATETKPVEDRESLSVVFGIAQSEWPNFCRELKESLVTLMSRYSEVSAIKDQVVCFSMHALTLLKNETKNEVN